MTAGRPPDSITACDRQQHGNRSTDRKPGAEHGAEREQLGDTKCSLRAKGLRPGEEQRGRRDDRAHEQLPGQVHAPARGKQRLTW